VKLCYPKSNSSSVKCSHVPEFTKAENFLRQKFSGQKTLNVDYMKCVRSNKSGYRINGPVIMAYSRHVNSFRPIRMFTISIDCKF